MGELPLIAIGHGNGHNYLWYTFLQSHLASYGYIVMSHYNNTGGSPLIETAADTTYLATDYILANQGTIGGGVLNGHIDSHRIAWIGHSRGGEGVVRAFDRLFDGVSVPVYYGVNDVVVVSSIAPTTFLAPSASDPHEVTYHFLYGAADGTVEGGLEGSRPFSLVDRARGTRQSTYLHGAEHNDFNCCGFDDFSGPAGTAIQRAEAQRIQKADYLALFKHYFEGYPAGRDYLFRQYEALKAIGAHYTSPETGAPVVVVKQFKEADAANKVVIDDFQTQPLSTLMSSGGMVQFNVTDVFEGLLRDTNTSFTWDPADPMNGMTSALAADVSRGVVFDWVDPGTANFYEMHIVPAQQDFSGYKVLSLRACQGTRHPNTTAVLADLVFSIELRDANGTGSMVNIGAFGGGVEEPYQRTGFGIGAGWANEWETIRVPLVSFQVNGSGLDLSKITRVTLWFGTAHGATQGRLGLDDVELLRE
jgi:hypothetical protein